MINYKGDSPVRRKGGKSRSFPFSSMRTAFSSGRNSEPMKLTKKKVKFGIINIRIN